MSNTREEKNVVNGNNDIYALTSSDIHLLEQVKSLTADYIAKLELKLVDLDQKMTSAHTLAAEQVTLKEKRKFMKIEHNKFTKKWASEIILGNLKNLSTICEKIPSGDKTEWAQSFWRCLILIINKQDYLLQAERIGWKGMVGIGYSDTVQLMNTYFANIYKIEAGLKEQFLAKVKAFGPPTNFGKTIYDTVYKAELRLIAKVVSIDLDGSELEPDLKKENKQQKGNVLSEVLNVISPFLNVCLDTKLNDAQLAEEADDVLINLHALLEKSKSIKSIGYKSALKGMFFMAPAKSDTTLLIEDIATQLESVMLLRPQIVEQLAP